MEENRNVPIPVNEENMPVIRKKNKFNRFSFFENHQISIHCGSIKLFRLEIKQHQSCSVCNAPNGSNLRRKNPNCAKKEVSHYPIKNPYGLLSRWISFLKFLWKFFLVIFTLMKKIFILFQIFVNCIFAATHVAVLETVSENGVLSRSEKLFLTDRLRERAKSVLPSYMGYVIMTRENIQQMLPLGKSIEDCEGNCLVETGKNIAADYVSQARIGKFGKQLTITVELYETAGNNLVGSFTAVKKDAEGLLDEIGKKSENLFKLVLGKNPIEIKTNKNISQNLNEETPKNNDYNNASEHTFFSDFQIENGAHLESKANLEPALAEYRAMISNMDKPSKEAEKKQKT